VSGVSEPTISLTDVVNKLGGMGKIKELYNIVRDLNDLSVEINSFVGRNTSYFIVSNDFKLTEIRIKGYLTGCLYYVTSADPQKLTLGELFDKFFSNTNTFYVNALKCMSDVLDKLYNIIDETLPRDEDDP
jgi:hypothetical protein